MEKIEKIKIVIDSIGPNYLKEEVNYDFYYDNTSVSSCGKCDCQLAGDDVKFLKNKLLQIFKILKNEQ